MKKFAFVNGYRQQVPETANNFLAKLAMVQQGVLHTNEIFQPMGRDMLRDLMWLDDILSRMALVTPLTNEQVGLAARSNEDDTIEILIYKLREKHSKVMFEEYLTFVKGAVSDPFLQGQDNPGHEGFQQAAVDGLHKSVILVRWMIETLTGKKDL